MIDEFQKFKVRDYVNWELYLHKNQFPYLGRCYAWAKRNDANELSDITSVESDELFEILIPDWEMGIYNLFGDFRTNFAIFGNEAPHLHSHLIPRYKNPILFNGVKFLDPNPKGNYAPYEKMNLPEEFLLGVRNKLESAILLSKIL